MVEIYKLSSYSNINIYQYPEDLRRENDDRRIVVYDDHRAILNVLYFAMQEGLFGDETPNVISFDRHDDAVPLSSSLKQKARRVKQNCFAQRNEKKMLQFVEFELRSLDDDWVRAGMELGLIKHYIGIGHKPEDTINIDEGYETYRTLDRQEHRLYSNGHLDYEFGSCGVIGNINYGWQQKRDDLLSDIPCTNSQFNNAPVAPYVFDVDLDCFAAEYDDHLMAWPEEIFFKHYRANIEVSSYVHKLIAQSSLITICREPGCCGGIGEANRILELLDYYWFEGALKTRRIQ